MAALTPMMKQYFEIKQQADDCVLFFRLGDFYEMFDRDALEASEILGITLTARSKGDGKIPMCGVPYHSAAGYIAKLTRAGRKVAICEQVSDPSLPGIVKREIIRIITPGTTLDENVLDDKTSNYLAAVARLAARRDAPASVVGDEKGLGLAMVEASTGEFFTMTIADTAMLMNELRKYQPREIIYSSDLKESLTEVQKHYNKAFWHAENIQGNAQEKMEKHFGPFELARQNLSSAEMLAASLALDFLAATQRTEIGSESLGHLKKIAQRSSLALLLDETTISNLEILENAREKKIEGSLLGILDRTITNSGGRLMKKFIIEPLSDLAAIEGRLTMIDFLLAHQSLILDLRLMLKQVMDIERILGRLNLGGGNARDLRALINSFKALTAIKIHLEKVAPILAKNIGCRMDLLPELFSVLERAVVEEAPFSVREGGLIQAGYNAELDELRGLSRDGKNFIQALQAREIECTGINSLKVKYNQVFGYYIEISNANLAQVPADYTRKQTLVNAERFTTPELKEYEEKVLTAEEKIGDLELKLFEELRQMVLVKTNELKETAAATAYLDVLVGLALVCWENRYVRPQFSENFDLKISGGRHPVIEKLNPQDKFVPNDTLLTESQKLVLITGPNMGGKSTYLRQTALIVLMAHLGMYVPADQAEIPLVDRIFTRVGASDNLVKGQSTFWVEMEETAAILKQATGKSLIVLDEIGRGTSTFDGVSIAWGIMEYIHQKLGAKTLFASHYHELIKLADNLPRAANFSVKVEEQGVDGVTFLYKIAPGGIDRSYGIEVAKLAGLPEVVIERAKEILQDLEKEQIGTGQQSMSLKVTEAPIPMMERKPAGLEKLKALDLNTLTPLEALNILNDWKKDV